MSAQTKDSINFFAGWFVKIIITISGFLLAYSFYEIKGDVKAIQADVQQIKFGQIKADFRLDALEKK